MPLTPAEKQRAYRERESEKMTRRTKALEDIITELGTPSGEKGRKILALAQEGLK